MRILQNTHFVQLLSMIAIFLLYGCSNDDNTQPEGTLTVSKKQMTVSASNFEGEPVEINASDNWIAKVSDRWILLSQISGEAGTGTLKVYVDNSAIGEAKNGYNGKITLSLVDNPEITKEIIVTREEENSSYYPTLYTLKIQHDYFEKTANTTFICQLSPQGAETARKIGLLFRQTAVNEWAVCFDPSFTQFGTDGVLSLELKRADSSLLYYTDWPDFKSSVAYHLELPGTETEQEATKAIQALDGSRPVVSRFCSVSLHLTDEMRKKALDGQPVKTSLHFPAKSVKWEYLFIARGGQGISGNEMMLEDSNKKIVFGEMKKTTVFGKECLSTTSVDKIPMRSSYDCRLRLMQLKDGNTKRILLSNVSLPVPGRFVSDDSNVMRQVCYY